MGNNSGKVSKKGSKRSSQTNNAAAYGNDESAENGSGSPTSIRPVRQQSAAIPVATSAIPAPVPGGKAGYQRPKVPHILQLRLFTNTWNDRDENVAAFIAFKPPNFRTQGSVDSESESEEERPAGGGARRRGSGENEEHSNGAADQSVRRPRPHAHHYCLDWCLEPPVEADITRCNITGAVLQPLKVEADITRCNVTRAVLQPLKATSVPACPLRIGNISLPDDINTMFFTTLLSAQIAGLSAIPLCYLRR